MSELIQLGDAQEFHLGYSRINKHMTCPRSYDYGYINKRPVKDTPALKRGNLYHYILEQLLKAKKQGKVITLREAQDFTETAAQHFGCNNTDTGIVKLGVHFYYSRMYSRHNPVVVEKDFTINRGGVKLTGRVDLITKEGFVVDHKFSGREWKKGRADYGIQPMIYQWAVDDYFSKKYDVPFTEFQYQICNTAPLQINTISIERISQDASDWWEEQVEKTARAIKCGSFPATPSEACDYCFYKDRCKPVKYPVVSKMMTLEEVD